MLVILQVIYIEKSDWGEVGILLFSYKFFFYFSVGLIEMILRFSLLLPERNMSSYHTNY